MYLLDINVVSELMAGNKAVVAKMISVSPSDVSVPQPVLSEIFYGLSRLRKSKRRDKLEHRFDLLSQQIGRCAWNDAVSQHFVGVKTRLQKIENVIEDLDIAIAAHALAHDLILVSANGKHMSRIRALRLEDWSLG